MIDCHVHSVLSHHGAGTLSDMVDAAKGLGIRVLGFTEHAPLPFDREHRLTKSEARAYLADIRRLARQESSMTILAGLEVDWHPDHETYLNNLLGTLEYDFALGSVHYFQTGSNLASIWDYESFGDSTLLSSYVDAVRGACMSGLFDAIAHPDAPLRAGIPVDELRNALRPILHLMPAYEANSAGFTKTRYHQSLHRMVPGPSFPDLRLAAEASRLVPIVVGSDAHQPELLGQGIRQLLAALAAEGVRDVFYYHDSSPIAECCCPPLTGVEES